MNNATDPRKFPFPPAIPVIALLLAWWLGWTWPITVHWPEWFRWVGWLLVTAAFVLAFWAIRTFRRHETVVDPRGKVTTIVTEGPFRYSRNPIYVALLLLYIGATMIFHLIWAVALLVPVFLALQYGVIIPEEQYLTATFGEKYVLYSRSVRRWM
jgi:protein-S-isoprenylcysteine O-methyltransferase Ste14